MEVENANRLQSNNENDASVLLPSVASGLVNSVLENVNDQIKSGSIEVSQNENGTQEVLENINESEPVISRTSPTLIPEIESAMEETSIQEPSIEEHSLQEPEIQEPEIQEPSSHDHSSQDHSSQQHHSLQEVNMNTSLTSLDIPDNSGEKPLQKSASDGVVTVLVSEAADNINDKAAEKSPVQEQTTQLEARPAPAGRRGSYFVEEEGGGEQQQLEEEEDEFSEAFAGKQEKSAEVIALETKVKQLQDKVKSLTQEVGVKDASLAESEKQRIYLEKDLNSMYAKLNRADKKTEQQQKQDGEMVPTKKAGPRPAARPARNERVEKSQSDSSKLCTLL